MRETGSVAPGKIGGHKPKSIVGELKKDFTLRGLSPSLPNEVLRLITRQCGALAAEKLSFNKARAGDATAPT